MLLVVVSFQFFGSCWLELEVRGVEERYHEKKQVHIGGTCVSTRNLKLVLWSFWFRFGQISVFADLIAPGLLKRSFPGYGLCLTRAADVLLWSPRHTTLLCFQAVWRMKPSTFEFGITGSLMTLKQYSHHKGPASTVHQTPVESCNH